MESTYGKVKREILPYEELVKLPYYVNKNIVKELVALSNVPYEIWERIYVMAFQVRRRSTQIIYPFGKKREITFWSKDGYKCWTEYIIDINDKIMRESDYTRGLKDGLKIVRQGDGPFDEMSYVDGVLNGPLITFYTNGNIEAIVYCVDGHRHGSRFTWYEDGSLKSEGCMYRGNMNGVWKTYYKEGGTKEVRTYIVKGNIGKLVSLLDGNVHRFWKNGKVSEYSRHELGNKNRSCLLMDKEERIISVENYVHSHLRFKIAILDTIGREVGQLDTSERKEWSIYREGEGTTYRPYEDIPFDSKYEYIRIKKNFLL